MFPNSEVDTGSFSNEDNDATSFSKFAVVSFLQSINQRLDQLIELNVANEREKHESKFLVEYLFEENKKLKAESAELAEKLKTMEDKLDALEEDNNFIKEEFFNRGDEIELLKRQNSTIKLEAEIDQKNADTVHKISMDIAIEKNKNLKSKLKAAHLKIKKLQNVNSYLIRPELNWLNTILAKDEIETNITCDAPTELGQLESFYVKCLDNINKQKNKLIDSCSASNRSEPQDFIVQTDFIEIDELDCNNMTIKLINMTNDAILINNWTLIGYDSNGIQLFNLKLTDYQTISSYENLSLSIDQNHSRFNEYLKRGEMSSSLFCIVIDQNRSVSLILKFSFNFRFLLNRASN